MTELNVTEALVDIEQKLDELVESFFPEQVAAGEGIPVEATNRVAEIMDHVRAVVRDIGSSGRPIADRQAG